MYELGTEHRVLSIVNVVDIEEVRIVNLPA